MKQQRTSWIFTHGFPQDTPPTHRYFTNRAQALRFSLYRAYQHKHHIVTSSLNKHIAKRAKAHHHPPTHCHYNYVTLGIGANIGTSQIITQRFFHLLRILSSHKRLRLIFASPIYRNPPFGYTKQQDFYNATITLYTSLSIVQVFCLVFYMERRFGRGRKRAFRNAPRTLDIDIIFYNNMIIKRAYLTIPHSAFHTRDSVLCPLSYEALWERLWRDKHISLPIT